MRHPLRVLGFRHDAWMVQWRGASALNAEWVPHAPHPDSSPEVEALARRLLEAGSLADWSKFASDKAVRRAKRRAFYDTAGLNKLKARCYTIALFVLFVIFPSLSTRIFRMTACDEFEANEDDRAACEAREGCMDMEDADDRADCLESCTLVRKLAQDYKIDCDVGDYPTIYAPYAYFMILVYPVGVPALYYLLLKQVQSKVFPATGDELRDVRLRTTVFAEKIEHVKFLFRSYEPRCWW